MSSDEDYIETVDIQERIKALNRGRYESDISMPSELEAEVRNLETPTDLQSALRWQKVSQQMEGYSAENCSSPAIEWWFQVVRRDLVKFLEYYRPGLSGSSLQQILTLSTLNGLTGLSLRQHTEAKTRIGIALTVFMTWNQSGTFYDELDWLQKDCGLLLLHERLLCYRRELSRRGRTADQYEEFKSQRDDIKTYWSYEITKLMRDSQRQPLHVESKDILGEILNLSPSRIEQQVKHAKNWLTCCSIAPELQSRWLCAVLLNCPLDKLSRRFNLT